MNDSTFDTLVHRLEQHAAAHPRRYNVRVALLALLGYAYIGVVLLALIAIGVACIWSMIETDTGSGGAIRLEIFVLVGVAAIIRALWVTIEPPTGRRLTMAEAPALFAEADELRRALRAPRPDVVLLDAEYNASVSQVPRLGIFGLPRNYLVVGLPLLEALPAPQVRAILAHEFAHLSRAHGSFGVWIYRVRATWIQLMQRFERSQHRLGFVFRRFFNWYTPLFSAHAFVLGRRHEYEADRLAADIVGRELMAQTLIDMEVRGQLLRARFWPGVWRDAQERDSAPDDVYRRLARESCTTLEDGDARLWLSSALKQRTDTTDTHPALRDRLAALVGAADGDALVASARDRLAATMRFDALAADHYLAVSHDWLAGEMASQWRQHIQPAWAKRHAALQKARDGLAQLAAKSAAGETPTPDERWQQADWTEDLEGDDVALPLYHALLADHPDHASANFAVGRVLLSYGDERGIEYLERVMAKDPDAIVPACRLAIGFFLSEGRLDEADHWRRRGAERATAERRARRERTVITGTDAYHAPELPPEVVHGIVAQLDRMQGIKRAYLARKELAHADGDAPLHVLIVVPRISYWTLNEAKAEAKFAAQLESIELPAGVNAFVVSERQGKSLLRPLRKAKGALVYEARKGARLQAIGSGL